MNIKKKEAGQDVSTANNVVKFWAKFDCYIQAIDVYYNSKIRISAKLCPNIGQHSKFKEKGW